MNYYVAVIIAAILMAILNAESRSCGVLNELWNAQNLPGPSEVRFAEAARVFYVSSRTERKLMVIEPLTGNVVRVVDLHFSPGRIEVSDDSSRVYIERVGEYAVSILTTESFSETGVVEISMNPRYDWYRTWDIGSRSGNLYAILGREGRLSSQSYRIAEYNGVSGNLIREIPSGEIHKVELTGHATSLDVAEDEGLAYVTLQGTSVDTVLSFDLRVGSPRSATSLPLRRSALVELDVTNSLLLIAGGEWLLGWPPNMGADGPRETQAGWSVELSSGAPRGTDSATGIGSVALDAVNGLVYAVNRSRGTLHALRTRDGAVNSWLEWREGAWSVGVDASDGVILVTRPLANDAIALTTPSQCKWDESARLNDVVSRDPKSRS